MTEESKALGAPPEEVDRLMRNERAAQSIRPITVVFDGKNLGVVVSVELLAFAAENGYPDWTDDRLKIIDPVAFARSVGKVLTQDEEDGSTPVTKMLDLAIIQAVESGCDGIDWDSRTVATTTDTGINNGPQVEAAGSEPEVSVALEDPIVSDTDPVVEEHGLTGAAGG